MTTKNYYTPKELAEIFGIHHFSVLRLIKNGEITAQRFGRCYLIAEKDAKAFVKRRTENTDGRALTTKGNEIK